ncbi:MAG: hypothetical protein ACI8XO_001050, partial [Verrucomicrobiales bacterium]
DLPAPGLIGLIRCLWRASVDGVDPIFQCRSGRSWKLRHRLLQLDFLIPYRLGWL